MTTNSAKPIRRLLSRGEAEEILGDGVFRDAFAAGWIRPRARKPGRGERSAKAIYALSDVRAVEERILAGEYPVYDSVSNKA